MASGITKSRNQHDAETVGDDVMNEPYPHETPRMMHPGRDESMSEAEQQHVRALVGSHSAGISFALAQGDETAIEQGVPPAIRYRAMAWAALHRAAMSAAHYIAMVKATDDEAATGAREIGEHLASLVAKQVPNSRETIAKIEGQSK